jgi:hypothetical protein
MIIKLIEEMKAKLWIEGVVPKWIFLSPLANERLLAEINERDGKKHKVIFEVCGLKVKIDPDCPSRGAYILGDEGEGQYGLAERGD